MSKGYWIGHIDVIDFEHYRDYLPASAAAIQAHGGRFLARGGTSEAVEGKARARHVIVEFPSYEAAIACYHSSEYVSARALRQPYSYAEIVIVEGAPTL